MDARGMFNLFHEREELKQALDLCRPLCSSRETTRGFSAADWSVGRSDPGSEEAPSRRLHDNQLVRQ